MSSWPNVEFKGGFNVVHLACMSWEDGCVQAFERSPADGFKLFRSNRNSRNFSLWYWNCWTACSRVLKECWSSRPRMRWTVARSEAMARNPNYWSVNLHREHDCCPVSCDMNGAHSTCMSMKLLAKLWKKVMGCPFALQETLIGLHKGRTVCLCAHELAS